MDEAIKIEKQEDEFGECEFVTSNVKDESSSRNGSTSNQIQTAFHSMEYHVCGKIAKVIVNRLEDVSTSRPQIKFQIKIEKQEEDEFGDCEFATSNVKDESSSHNGSTSNEMARVKQENDSSQEPAPECSIACSQTDDDFSQQNYLIPGYNLIYIKEEEYVEQEAEGCSVESEPEMWPSNCSTSETANATEVDGLNVHSISPVEKCTEPTVAGKKIKLYNCADCSYGATQIGNLKRHMRKHTGEKPFSCELCDYKCAQSSALKLHIITHTGETPFSCEYCEYKCAQSSALKSHIRTHTGETPYSCEYCDYKSARSSALKSHIRTHTGETPYSCEYCDYKCATSSNLKLHIITHTGETPFSCEFCNYKSARSNTLKEHIRTHTGETPFSCKFCNYKSAQSNTLKEHIRTHTGERPFSCEYCDYKCARSSALKSHIRTHTGETPFSCEYCDYKCSDASNLNKHIRTHKGETSTS
ncbi:gastrula zinc finger protein XlCGF57.1-like isoform X2 [Nilaparvata lugens]|uniref:gastrula zinc finger protein XlCGF57.1-like isoform X2 n=1 Tax=Nilaparvata lugens TaxID=108931 RepID=UPI00193E2D3B|nr:gastrula zinc finger protein XlCGF57.1-like isoform X2 [Nilaparvata lugens]